MKGQMISAVAAVSVTLLLGACSSGMTKEQRLSLYESNAGEPIAKINYFSPQGWEEVDRNHVVVTMRPKESYLMRLSGPCLDYDNGAAAMVITTQTGAWVQAKFDRVAFAGSNMNCRIEEIRPLDIEAVRASRKAMESKTI
ncbi:hypothetical protein LF41_573 [Lysobacter dokdonensis DS-58]|uniref:Lipoprotein n=1 Tax=Lysobacter dokdonensis DS-58 TaxID=1300345 RepID=A0A0A2WFM2_9GAMM|nr:DUF6491 family protein [Lysobacter dokdonensis]KGQ18548.1 hypothetical protein LF41_573 [Lysobacter dokdonensis DS-58]